MIINTEEEPLSAAVKDGHLLYIDSKGLLKIVELKVGATRDAFKVVPEETEIDLGKEIIALGADKDGVVMLTKDSSMWYGSIEDLKKGNVAFKSVKGNENIEFPFSPYTEPMASVIIPFEYGGKKLFFLKGVWRKYFEIIDESGKRLWKACCGNVLGPSYWPKPGLIYTYLDTAFIARMKEIVEERFCNDNTPISCSERLNVKDFDFLWASPSVVAKMSASGSEVEVTLLNKEEKISFDLSPLGDARGMTYHGFACSENVTLLLTDTGMILISRSSPQTFSFDRAEGMKVAVPSDNSFIVFLRKRSLLGIYSS
ncbi:hypothetical protein IPA_02030 [Ignicoccus pacificus DSM 13166]|uniref:Uncharacterized protein n=1 Tax=Ignicoccus pacificus DSM 13166 TaxID=940294 RepID=A0A977KAL3_9CREN|nr:hypothetical protein IPA_02030 [Ignicoccus pacificus DSM 13166]